MIPYYLEDTSSPVMYVCHAKPPSIPTKFSSARAAKSVDVIIWFTVLTICLLISNGIMSLFSLGQSYCVDPIPDSKVNVANMEPTWVMSAPDGPCVGPMNRVIRDVLYNKGKRWVSSCGVCNSDWFVNVGPLFPVAKIVIYIYFARMIARFIGPQVGPILATWTLRTVSSQLYQSKNPIVLLGTI